MKKVHLFYAILFICAFSLAVWDITSSIDEDTIVSGFKLPGTGDTASEEEGLHEFMRKTREQDLGSSRDGSVDRKASEDKKPWLGSDLQSLESIVWPHAEISPWNFDIPTIVENPDKIYRPGDSGAGWYVAGCAILGPSSVECNDCAPLQSPPDCGGSKPFTEQIITGQIINSIQVKGPVAGWKKIKGGKQGSRTIEITPMTDVDDGSAIEILVRTSPLGWQERAGECYKKVRVTCVSPSCDCSTADTFVIDDSSGTTIDPGGNATINVDGGCGPYTWEVTGTGYSFSASETGVTTNTLTSAAGT